MDAALKEVRKGHTTCYAASKTFGVPRTTLRDKLTGRSPEGRQMGPNPVLTRVKEQSTVNPQRVFNFDESLSTCQEKGESLRPVNYKNFLEVSKE